MGGLEGGRLAAFAVAGQEATRLGVEQEQQVFVDDERIEGGIVDGGEGIAAREMTQARLGVVQALAQGTLGEGSGYLGRGLPPPAFGR